MSATTVYEVKLRYSVENNGAAAQTKQLTRQTRELAQESRSAGLELGRLATAAASAFGAREVVKSMFDFNRQIENAKVKIGGLLQMNMGGEFEKNIATATDMIDRFQRMAQQGVGETTDYVDMSSMIVGPATRAGASIKQLTQLTQGAVVASKAFGINAEMAALDIEQALAGTLSSKDRFARALLEPMKLTTEKFNALAGPERLAKLYEAMTQPAIKNMADAYEKTFDGATSALKDNITITLGKVGKPLFDAITVEARRLNAWFQAHQVTVTAWARSVGDGLVSAFRVVKDAVSFLVGHADTLLSIGKVWAAVKIGGAISAGLGGLGAGGGGVLGQLFAKNFGGTGGFFRNKSDGGEAGAKDGTFFSGGYQYSEAGRGQQSWRAGGLKGAIGNLGPVAQVLVASYTISRELFRMSGVTKAVSDAIDPQRAELEQLTRSMNSFDDAVLNAAAELSKIKGAGGSITNAQQSTLADVQKRQANVTRDLLREGLLGGEQDMWSEARRAQARTKMEETGLFDADEMKRAMATPEKFASTQELSARTLDYRRDQSVAVANSAWESIPEDLRKTLDQQEVTNELMQRATQMMGAFEPGKFQNAVMLDRDTTFDVLRGMGVDTNKGKDNKMKAPGAVTINISRIEVQSDDPDRYAFGLVEAFRDAVRNPGEAASRATRVR